MRIGECIGRVRPARPKALEPRDLGGGNPRTARHYARLLLRAEEQVRESAMIPYAIAVLLTILTVPKLAALIARELEIRLIDTVCLASYGAGAGGVTSTSSPPVTGQLEISCGAVPGGGVGRDRRLCPLHEGELIARAGARGGGGDGMNLKDRFAEFVLAAFDRFMDFITLGMFDKFKRDTD